jgi:hypothetical protein
VAAKSGVVVTIENLRADLNALPGVASAEVALDDEAVPVARVWLDGSRSGEDVRGLVDGLVANTMPSIVLPQQKRSRRRIGLGRGLVDLLPTEESDRIPTHLQPSAGNRHSIVGVAVIESDLGVTVEIESDDRGIHSELVADDGDVEAAVVRGVIAIVGIGVDVRLDTTYVESNGGSVALVSVFHRGKRAVGAAFVEYGRPYAVARASFSALRDL